MKHIYRTTFLSLAILFSVGLILPQSAQAHCQIPCGIYDDYARLQFMLEDAATVEKSVKTMIKLTGKTDYAVPKRLFRTTETSPCCDSGRHEGQAKR